MPLPRAWIRVSARCPSTDLRRFHRSRRQPTPSRPSALTARKRRRLPYSSTHAARISIIQPDGIDDTADTGFTIQWIDDDPDDDAAVSLYYDTDNSGADGTLIVSGLSEDADEPGEDQYVWDTSAIAEGSYYVYAVIDDGKQ